MKFEVGDKVWIPTREKLVQKFGLYADGSIRTSPGIAGVMNQFCGQKVTIAKVLYSGSYRIEEDGHRFFGPERFSNDVLIMALLKIAVLL